MKIKLERSIFIYNYYPYQFNQADDYDDFCNYYEDDNIQYADGYDEYYDDDDDYDYDDLYDNDDYENIDKTKSRQQGNLNPDMVNPQSQRPPFGPSMDQMPPFGPSMEQKPPFGPQMGQQPPFGPQMGQQPPFGPQMGQQSHFRPPFTPPFGRPDQFQRFRRCMYHISFVTLNNGSRFWFYPTDIRRQRLAGFRWRRNRWEPYSIDTFRIVRINCNY